MSGMRASKKPKAIPTRILVRALIPLSPIPIAPAKLLRPTDTLTSRRLISAATGVTIWRAQASAVRLQYLTKTLCQPAKSDPEWHRICNRLCHPKLGQQSLKPYNPARQERYEAQAARPSRGPTPGLAIRPHLSRRAAFHPPRALLHPLTPS